MLLFLLLIIPHFKTGYVGSIPIADSLFNVARVASVALIVFLYIIKRRRADIRAGVLILFVLCLLLSTVLNEGFSTSLRYIYAYALSLGVYLFVDLYSDHPDVVVSALFYIGEVLVYLNLLAILLFPDGLYVSELLGYYHNWILGYKNVFLPFFICFAAAAFLRMRYTGKSARSLALVVAMLVSLVLAKSSTSLIVMIVFVLGMLLSTLHLKLVFNPYVLAGIVAVVFFAMVLMSSSEAVSGLIATIANRDATFSGRTFIWSSVLDSIIQRPLLGWGVMPEAAHIELLDNAEATSAHNYYLEVLFSGGVLAFSMFCLFLVLVFKKIKSCEGSYSAKVFSMAMFAIGLAFLTEAYSNPLIFIVFALAANTDRFASFEPSSEKPVIPSRVPEKAPQST